MFPSTQGRIDSPINSSTRDIGQDPTVFEQAVPGIEGAVESREIRMQVSAVGNSSYSAFPSPRKIQVRGGLATKHGPSNEVWRRKLIAFVVSMTRMGSLATAAHSGEKAVAKTVNYRFARRALLRILPFVEKQRNRPQCVAILSQSARMRDSPRKTPISR